MELKKLRSFMLIFGTVVLILVFTSFFSAANLNRATTLTIDLVSLQEVSQASKSISIALEDERIAIGQYQLSGDEELLTRILNAQAEYDLNWDVITNNLGIEQAQLISETAAARSTYKELLDEVITEYQSNPSDNQSSAKLRDAINYYLQYLNPRYDGLIEPELQELARLTEIERSNVQRNSFIARTVLALSILVGIAVVLVVSAALYFSTKLIKSMTSIIDAANAISRGDLDVPIEIGQAGEIGELAKAIDRMRTSLKAAIERLRR